MFEAVANYCSRASEDIGRAWNRFWFLPTNPLPLAVLRIVVGILALYYLASFTADLVELFGSRGMLSTRTVYRMMQDADGAFAPKRYHLSLLYAASQPKELWALHSVGLLCVLLFTLGLFTRVTCVLSLVFVLSYMQRAPMIIGQMEPVLAMSLLYLCIGPAGAYLSLDRLRAKKKKAAQASNQDHESWWANLSLRLLQVHVAGLYLLIGLSQVSGLIWQDGTAVWWLAALSESRLINVTGMLTDAPYLYNLLTHIVIGFELCFGILIWNRTARPLLLALSVPIWIMLALLSGLVGYAVLMIALGIVFVPAEVLEKLLQREQASPSGAKPVVAA